MSVFMGILLLTILPCFQSKAQINLMTESFEFGGIVPPNWATEVLGGSTNILSFVTSSTYPAGFTAHDGTYMVRFNSWSFVYAINRLKRTLPVSTVGCSGLKVNFAWLESSDYSTSFDKVEVQWSTDAVTWNTAGTFSRYNAVQGWKVKACPLPPEAHEQPVLYIAFLFTSDYGDDCYLDLATLTYDSPSYSLPFTENWSNGTFDHNKWEFPNGQGNWTVNLLAGNPVPCADFTGIPAVNFYNYSLVSPVLDGRSWSCGNIWFNFNIRLLNINPTQNETLLVEIFHDGAWYYKTSFPNSGSTGWIIQHLDISEVMGKEFRIRFRVNGNYSTDIQHWYVDNINVYGTCNPPVSLVAGSSGFNTDLSWSPPACPNVNGDLNWIILDDGSAENGWSINTGYNDWLGNEFPLAPTTTGTIQMVKFWGWENAAHGSDKVTMDFFDAAHQYIGSSIPFQIPGNAWDSVVVDNIPFSGTFYGMIHWNYVEAATNWVGYDQQQSKIDYTQAFEDYVRSTR